MVLVVCVLLSTFIPPVASMEGSKAHILLANSADELLQKGRDFLKPGSEQDYQKAAELFKKVIADPSRSLISSAWAHLELAKIFRFGWGVPVNETMTFVHIKLASLAITNAHGDVDELVEVAKIVQDKHFDPHALDDRQRPLLHGAVGRGQKELAAVLLQMGAKHSVQDSNRATCMQLAIQSSSYGNGFRKNLVELLLSFGASWSHFHVAIFGGKIDTVKELLPETDVNAQDEYGLTPLHVAAWVGNEEILELLINQGALCTIGTSCENILPVHLAAWFNFSKIVERLLPLGHSVNAEDGKKRTPLIYAARGGHTDMVRFLIGCDADLNVVSENKVTATHIAALNGKHELLKLLLEAGADLRLGISSPLRQAASFGRLECVILLLRHGADIHEVNAIDMTALHAACLGGHTEIVRLLLSSGAKIEARSKLGLTPLHCAAMNGMVEVVEVLLQAGANKRVRDLLGKTPLEDARDKGHSEIVKILEKSFMSDIVRKK